MTLTNIISSWSLDQIFDDNLYKNKVKNIPKTFQSVTEYMSSFIFPLLEETRTSLCSSMDMISLAPFAEVTALEERKPYGSSLYQVKVEPWKNRFNNRGKEPYKTMHGDILLLADAKPESVADLHRVGRQWVFSFVTAIEEPYDEDEGEQYSDLEEGSSSHAHGKKKESNVNDIIPSGSSTNFKIQAASKVFSAEDMKQKSFYVIFLINITTNKRIWNALGMSGGPVIREVLCTDDLVEKKCEFCPTQGNDIYGGEFIASWSSQLNESQTQAVLTCLNKSQCNHRSSVELIWGPPGTGKTKTVSILLFSLLKIKCSTLVCTPTNVAVTEVASRVVHLLRESNQGDDTPLCSLGDLLLFGNKERLKVDDSEFKEIYLDHRVDKLTKLFAEWQSCFHVLTYSLEDCVSEYEIYLENKSIIDQQTESIPEPGRGCKKEREVKRNKPIKEPTCFLSKQGSIGIQGSKVENESFLGYMRGLFRRKAAPVIDCLLTLCTHISKSYITEQHFQQCMYLVDLLNDFEALLHRDDLLSEELQNLFSSREIISRSTHILSDDLSLICSRRNRCIHMLKNLHKCLANLDFPRPTEKLDIVNFCFRNACIFFCTASSSVKLHKVVHKRLELLVIDEAAQLKECESTIPLQLPGVKHAILIGDELQLPAMVESKLSDEAGFGRSLFERLSLLGHSKHLLNIQYRMHPSISRFPNSTFYQNQIIDAANVTSKGYLKYYLPGPMFGPYSFINVTGGREEFDDVGHSRRNMVEVAVVLRLIRNLYKGRDLNQNLSVGVISPYTAQIVAIQERLGRKYENLDGFTLKVKSVDGFQGGETDIIIMSTVRSNGGGAIGFLSNPQRTNVALTRAKHTLWILGNDKTLDRSDSVWGDLVRDAKNRQCFYNADSDAELAKVILEVKKQYNELDDLLNENSVLFKNARWKVLFSDNFRNSFGKLTSKRTKMAVLNLLLKLSSGWRPKKRSVDIMCERSRMILKQFKVEQLCIVCSIDIVKDQSYVQVLKVWDLMPPGDISKLVQRLDSIFEKYTDDFVCRCNLKYLEGDTEVPKTWIASLDLVRYERGCNKEGGNGFSADGSDSRCYVENSKVRDSLLLMKFYSLTSDLVNNLLSDNEGIDLPFEVTDEENEMISFPSSTFILGRSGTGKTTVLTMKLFKREQVFHMLNKGSLKPSGTICSRNITADALVETEETVLRQLFVTVSSKLCYAVRHHVSHLKRSLSGRTVTAEYTPLDVYDIACSDQFKGIPESFIHIPSESYPLIITLSKFLLMLDQTIGVSYFERFRDARELLHSGCSTSFALHSFMKIREVEYDKFCSSYWPRLNSQVTKKLDSSRVFTEIMSHIKGGERAGNSVCGRLSRGDYVDLSEGRTSTLSTRTREMIYDIFLDYEKLKMENGEFDMCDLVIDLHRRMKSERYTGEMMNFVYIDEVQDFTMQQVSLFKYICQNVEEGFVFSGDTAQTIARGIDFRFEEIRSLFYNEFILEPNNEVLDGKKQKGQMSKIFQLSQNFRTHDGVLRLAQSILDLLYHYFPLFVDVLGNESSLISGESPVLLKPGREQNAITTIFGNTGSKGVDFVGFGAEQVILVRDDAAKTEISKHVGKQALVLTIVECKGLEFQDVLLYNFFSSSPFKNQWRVLYEYMNEKDMLDSSSFVSFPCFSQSKHNVLCSELKQLYVAITRTRQRLWICENSDEFSKPMFDYWKTKCLVEVRELDDSLARAMQVASSSEDWKSRGYKLLQEGNFEMATMCFERAGDRYGETFSRACRLRAAADRMHVLNHEMASVTRREAAELFYSIGKAESAAECFYMLKEYERAGRIFYEKCSESYLERAGECFSLAGCYKLASEVYAKVNHFAKCLRCCVKGELFDLGLQYIKDWKQNYHISDYETTKKREIEKIEQDFLKSCAHRFHELNKKSVMMEYVRSFSTMDSRRGFLKSLGCFDALLLLEVEFGNFLEAATIARSRGGVLLEAGVLGSSENYKDVSRFLLFYVFSNSLWSAESKGWPLKHFKLKEELLSRAKMFAKNASGQFYKFVCAEADNLSNEKLVLPAMKKQLDLSRSCKSLRGEFICARRILDHHLNWSPSRYVSEEYVVLDLTIYSEDRISSNMVSVETLVFFWNLWKDMVVQILKYLQQLKIQDGDEYKRYGDLCLSYFGVWIKSENLVPGCFLLNPNAEWLKELDSSCFHKRGTLISINHSDFLSAARSYWTSELLSVGIKMLETLESIYNLSTKSVCSIFRKSNYLIHIFEAAKFLLKPEFLNGGLYTERLQGFVRIATKNIVDYICPLNWYESLTEHVIRLGGTEAMQNLLEEVITGILNSKNKMSYREIGKLVVVVLGAGKLNNALYLRIAERLKWNEPWSAFIGNLCEGLNLCMFYEALCETSNANWSNVDYISPECFLYLLERFVFLLFLKEEYLFFTKHSFIDWLTYREENTGPVSGLIMEDSELLEEMLDFIANYVQRFLYYIDDAARWIKNFHSNIENCHLLLASRMVSLLCLLIFNSNRYFRVLCELGNWPMFCFYGDIRNGVRKFSELAGCSRLSSGAYISTGQTRNGVRKFSELAGCSRLSSGAYISTGQTEISKAISHVLALCEAFQNIGTPIVTLVYGTRSKFAYPGITCINLEVYRSKEEILKILFPKKIIQAARSGNDKPVKHSKSSSLVLRVDETRSQSGLQLNKDKGSQVPDEKASGDFEAVEEDRKGKAKAKAKKNKGSKKSKNKRKGKKH